MEEGLGQSDPLEHAFGVGAEGASGTPFESDQGEKFFGTILKKFTGEIAKAAVVSEGFSACEEVGEVGVFGEEPDPTAGFHGSGGVSEDFDAAGGRSDESEEEFHRGAFAGAVGTEETIDFSGLDPEVELVQGEEFAPTPVEFEGFAETTGVDGGLWFTRGSLRWHRL